MTDDSLDALYFELPIMRGERLIACQKLGIAPGTLWRRLDRLRTEGLAVFIGTGWLPTSDSWIEEGNNEKVRLLPSASNR